MTEESGENDGADQLRDEAATWFARMRGPDAAMHRDAFDRWLARGAVHRGAYNRIAEVFAAGKLLKQERSQPDVRERRMIAWVAVAVPGLAIIAGVLAWLQPGRLIRADPRRSEIVQYSNGVGKLRRVRLADGTTVILDSDTLIAARMMPAVRMVWLEHGRARFEVGRSPVAFWVLAGPIKVTARGTVFDVARTDDGRTDVRLIAGRVAVGSANAQPADGPSPLLLEPGQRIVADPVGALRMPVRDAKTDDWTTGSRTFRGVALDELVREANRYAVRDIVIEDPELSQTRVSGTFRISDPDALTRHLAALFDLTVDQSRDGVVVLRRAMPGKNFR